MLDGGMADSLPIEKAIAEGWEKILVILTRKEDYRKKYRHLYMRGIKLVYRKYPNFIRTMEHRHQKYNACLEKINQLEKEGRVMVIRPTELVINNNESDVKKLMDYYNHGYEQAKGREQELVSFLTT